MLTVCSRGGGLPGIMTGQHLCTLVDRPFPGDKRRPWGTVPECLGDRGVGWRVPISQLHHLQIGIIIRPTSWAYWKAKWIIMLSALGLRLKEVGEALASGIEFKGTPKNSVISINHILVQPLKKKTKVKKIRDELNIKILQRSKITNSSVWIYTRSWVKTDTHMHSHRYAFIYFLEVELFSELDFEKDSFAPIQRESEIISSVWGKNKIFRLKIMLCILIHLLINFSVLFSTLTFWGKK